MNRKNLKIFLSILFISLCVAISVYFYGCDNAFEQFIEYLIDSFYGVRLDLTPSFITQDLDF